MLCSCQKEEEAATKIPPHSEFPSLIINNEGMLKFSSQTAVQDTLIMLSRLTEEEQTAWNSRHNFKPLDVFYWEALDELESIQNSTTRQEYTDRYRKFRQKYSPYFLFNEKDPSDLSPYIASNCETYALIANIDGNYMIGDSIININKIKKFSDFNFSKYLLQQPATKSTPEFDEHDNFLYIRHDKRKMWAEVQKEGSQIWIKLSAHKKGTFGGWNKYKTEYYIRYIHHEPETWMGIDTYFQHIIDIAPEYYNTSEISSGATKFLGTSYYQEKAFAVLEIYSRGTGAEHPGTLTINM